MVNDARNRLRSMGGIMASSPELMQAAGFQQGGTVAPVVPSVTGAPQSPGMPPEGLNFAEWMELSRREREDLDYPVSIVGGQMHFPDRVTRVLPDAAQEEVAVTPAEDLRLAQADQLRGALGYPASGLAREAEEAAARRLDAEAPVTDALADRDTRARAQKELQRVVPGGMQIGEADPDRVAEANAEEDRASRAAAQQRLQDTAPEDLLTLGGKLAPPPEDNDNTPSAKRTLRERYEQRLELFKDIFGESDEARARDRAMSLAMLGLAIASGQSPNALTNIAQGAMVGLQGMSEQERARREREQELQTMALESALGDIDAEREAQRRAEEAKTEFDREVILKSMDVEGSGFTTPTNPTNVASTFIRDVREESRDPTSALYRQIKDLPLEQQDRVIYKRAQDLMRPLYGDNTPDLTAFETIEQVNNAQGLSDEEIDQMIGMG